MFSVFGYIFSDENIKIRLALLINFSFAILLESANINVWNKCNVNKWKYKNIFMLMEIWKLD